MQSKIISAVRKFDTAVRKTVMTEAINVANAVTDEWETMDRDTAKEIAGEIVKDYPEGSRYARRSEWAAFILAAPEGLAHAIRYAQKEMKSFTRVDLFKLCRILPAADGYKDAVAKLIADKNKKPSKGGARSGRSVAAVVKSLFAIQTRKRNEIAFRKELAQLCEKHGINYA